MLSKVWDAQDALYDALVASGSFTDAQLTFGTPTRDQPVMVWVHGQVDDWAMQYRVSGALAKDEQFTLRVSIAVTRLGVDYRPAREEVRALAQAVEDVVAADVTLGGVVELAVIERGQLEDSLVDDRHRGVGITLFVRCRAWLNS